MKKRYSPAVKNYLKLQELIKTTNYEFLMDLNKIKRKYNFPDLKLGNYIDLHEKYGKKSADKIKMEAYKNRMEFLQKLENENKNQYLNLMEDILELIKKYNLGFNWGAYFLDFFISGYEEIPSDNLSYWTENNRVNIRLNPNTSFKDIEDAWPKIKEELNNLYSPARRKKYYFSEEKIKNFDIIYKDWQEKVKEKLGMEEEHPTLFPEDAYKLTDLDVVGRIYNDDNEEEDFSIKEDKKKANRLRTTRHRYKKNIT